MKNKVVLYVERIPVAELKEIAAIFLRIDAQETLEGDSDILSRFYREMPLESSVSVKTGIFRAMVTKRIFEIFSEN